jgi:hypothetical protein
LHCLDLGGLFLGRIPHTAGTHIRQLVEPGWLDLGWAAANIPIHVELYVGVRLIGYLISTWLSQLCLL